MKRIAFVGLLVVLTLSACGGTSGKATPLPTVALDSANQTQPAVKSTSVSETPAAHQSTGGGVTASGTVTSLHQAQFVANSSGSVQSVNTSVGTDVKSGDLLVVLSGREKMKASVEAARLELLIRATGIGYRQPRR